MDEDCISTKRIAIVLLFSQAKGSVASAREPTDLLAPTTTPGGGPCHPVLFS